MKLDDYGDLRDAAAEAAQVQKKCEMGLLAALEAMDPELVKDGLDLWESAREELAHYLTGPIPAMGGATCYELLAAGERARVIQLFNAVRYGIYL